MGSAVKSTVHKDVMLDIDSELAYWRMNYVGAAFHRTPRPFEDYVFTLKFGYDMYLLNSGCDMERILPAMRSRYEATAMSRENLGWPLAEAVIRETWKRMHRDRHGSGKPKPVVEPPRTSWSQPQYRSV